jgi:hypothetical protein
MRCTGIPTCDWVSGRETTFPGSGSPIVADIAVVAGQSYTLLLGFSAVGTLPVTDFTLTTAMR